MSRYQEQMQIEEDNFNQNQNEEDFEHNYDLCKEIHNNMMREIKNSPNPWLLNNCSASDIMDLIENGKFELPNYVLSRNKIKVDNLDSIPQPIDIHNIKPIDNSEGWVVLKGKKRRNRKKSSNKKSE